jgi:hypothetical protein
VAEHLQLGTARIKGTPGGTGMAGFLTFLTGVSQHAEQDKDKDFVCESVEVHELNRFGVAATYHIVSINVTR